MQEECAHLNRRKAVMFWTHSLRRLLVNYITGRPLLLMMRKESNLDSLLHKVYTRWVGLWESKI